MIPPCIKGQKRLGCKKKLNSRNDLDHPVLLKLRIEVLGLPWYSDSKESACNAKNPLDPWIGKIPWRRKWQPIPVFLPGEFHGRAAVHRTAKSWTRLSNTNYRGAETLVLLSSLFYPVELWGCHQNHTQGSPFSHLSLKATECSTSERI